MKLIIFIHTCALYENTRAKLLENTWANNKDIVFITDNDSSELKNHIYIGPYEKGPTYHPNNVKKMFNLFLEKYSDYDYFMIIDDDSYLYIEKLKLFLSFFEKDEPYMIGDFLNWTHKHNNFKYGGKYQYWVGGGPGIVFTKSCIIEFMYIYNKLHIEDANHDIWLHNLFKYSNGKIKRTHCPGFHQYDGENLYKKYSLNDNNLVSIHLNHDMSLLSKYHII
uniref:Fringe-like glycosyltransferase domain-containing protein n=1 Tax=viral metagenome TaxID=1070528 RepID=A0A6C0KS15_9ZZZZ